MGVKMEHLQTSRSRALRKNLTDAEKLLWRHLRCRQVGEHKFRRQYPLGNYIVDFVCLKARLIVEIDGGQHAEQAEYDAKRDAWLEQQQFRVLRFWNTQVMQETAAVLAVIDATLNNDHPHPNLPPSRGKE